MKICLTIDSDWTIKSVTQYTIDILKDHNIPFTFFATVNQEIEEEDLFEVAWHPNCESLRKIEEEFKGLLAMSSYHHVKDGIEYPAVLLTHGMNDPRVDPWNSAKMTARLQAATASNKPILFRVEYSAGHGIGSTRKQYLEELADEWAFLLWQFDQE